MERDRGKNEVHEAHVQMVYFCSWIRRDNNLYRVFSIRWIDNWQDIHHCFSFDFNPFEFSHQFEINDIAVFLFLFRFSAFSANVHVTVNDINEYSPTFLQPSYVIEVSSDECIQNARLPF